MKKIAHKISLLALFTGCLALVGCHTMHGLGEDISSGGQALAHAAEGKKKSKATQKNKTTQNASASSSN